LSVNNIKEKFGKERILEEIKESYEHKLVQRLEAPLIGLILFSIALWGSKLFTLISPGTSLFFHIGSYTIHFHHFHYGIIALAIGLVLTFFEGKWFVRIEHGLFGAGLGFIVDEYWLLLTFDAATYFGPESQFISVMIGLVITIIYLAITFGVYYRSRGERKLWKELYNAVKSGEIRLDL
jgi:membrane-bound ClpP family serine protease